MTDKQPFIIEQNIRRKVLWPLGIIIAISFAVFLFVSDYYMEHAIDRLQDTQLQNLTTRYHGYMLERTKLMRSIMQQLSRDPAMLEALDRRDRSFLLQHSNPLFKELLVEQNITHFYYHTPDGTNLLRVHKPDKHSDLIDRITLHTAQLKQTISDGIELGPLGTFTLRVVMPIHKQNRLIGYLELGEDIDPIIDQLTSDGDNKIAVLILKRLIDQDAWIEGRQLLNETANWGILSDYVVSGTDDPQIIKALPLLTTPAAINDAETVEMILNNKIHRGRFLNMMDVGGRSVGSLLVLQDVQELLDNHRSSTLMITLFSGLMAVTLFWIASHILGRADRSLRLIREQLDDEKSEEVKRPVTFKFKQEEPD